MELEEAIIHAEAVADRCAVTDGNIKCEMEHRQLAEWLKELKERREKDEQSKTFSCSEKPNRSDLISRQAAIDELKRISFSHWFEYVEYLSEDTREIEIINSDKALEVIEALPSEQPEIVRCKDCKYWREHKYAKETKRYIPFCGFNAIYTKADDFCSRAERRTDG